MKEKQNKMDDIIFHNIQKTGSSCRIKLKVTRQTKVKWTIIRTHVREFPQAAHRQLLYIKVDIIAQTLWQMQKSAWSLKLPMM